MRHVVLQFLGIFFVAAMAAWVTRSLSRPIQREIRCDASTLKPGEICLATVQEKWQADVLWIDARSQDDWRRDGIPGSIWVTHEQFDASLAEAAPRLIEGKPVIVYCSAVGCGTSLEIAQRIRDFQLAKEVHALHGGWKTLQQAGLVQKQ